MIQNIHAHARNLWMKNSPQTDIFMENPNITIFFFEKSRVQKLLKFKVIFLYSLLKKLKVFLFFQCYSTWFS